MTGMTAGTARAETDIEDESAVPPAHGRLVTVRNRRWVVTEVTRSTVSSKDPARTAGCVGDPSGDPGLRRERRPWKKAAPKRKPSGELDPQPGEGFQDGLFGHPNGLFR